MGALPNYPPQPETTTRKPAVKARKAKARQEACTPRTLPEIQADYRSRTNYEQGKGYFPMFHALAEDLLRLSSGRVCDWVIQLTLQEMSIKGAGTHALKPEVEMSVSELALRIQCDERQINRVIEYLVARGMAAVERSEGARFLIQLSYGTWGCIEETYQQWDARRRAAEEAENPDQETEEQEQEIPVKAGTVTLTKTPVRVAAGERSRPIKVNTGIRSLRIHWESKVLDLSFRAAVVSGELILHGDVPKAESLKSKYDAKLEKSTRSKQTSGHGCPNGAKIPPSEGNDSHPHKRVTYTTPVEHPRAAELAKLFDPLIYNHTHQTLSGDAKYHSQACEAIANVPHDVLVKAAVERASRTLKPQHVPALCRQIHHDWTQGKNMPEPQRPATPQTKGAQRAERLIQGLKALDRIRGRKA